MKKHADQEMLATCGLTAIQVGVLMQIHEAGALRQNQIADHFGLNESAITALITRLRSKDMVIKSKSPKDARALQLTITEAGKQALALAGPSFAITNAQIDAQLGQENIETLTALLNSIEQVILPKP